jgi:pterin-4a-carbinolamine dehydratase
MTVVRPHIPGTPQDLFSDRELEWAHAASRGWRTQGNALVREMRFRSFEDAFAFVQCVAEAAVDYGRRPDVCIASGHVRLSIANRHHAGPTVAELRLAAKVNAVIEGQHARDVAT